VSLVDTDVLGGLNERHDDWWEYWFVVVELSSVRCAERGGRRRWKTMSPSGTYIHIVNHGARQMLSSRFTFHHRRKPKLGRCPQCGVSIRNRAVRLCLVQPADRESATRHGSRWWKGAALLSESSIRVQISPHLSPVQVWRAALSCSITVTKTAITATACV
jgi:hypothetical protein